MDYELLNRAIVRQGGQPLPAPQQTPLDAPTTGALDAALAVPLGAQVPPPAAPPPTPEPPPAVLRTIEPAAAAPNPYGAVEPGNIDLAARPVVKNPDGSISTVRSMGVNIDGKEYLIPTVSDDGRIMSDDEAVDTFRRTGKHLGVYASPAASTAAAQAIHNDQAKLYGGSASAPPPSVVRTIMPAAPPPAPSLGTAQGYGIDETMRSLDELTTAQAEAAMRAGEAEGAAGKRKADAGNVYAREVDEISKRHATLGPAAEEMFQRTMAEMRALNEAANKLPPPRDRRNRGQRVWGVLAAALGGEDTIRLINEGVDRDIKLQQAEIDNKRKGAESKLNEWNLARQYISDEREAAKFAAALRKERFAGEVEAAAGELTSQTARDKGLQVAAQYKVEARQQQIGILKSVMGSKMNALEAAMLVGSRVMSPAEARAALGVGQGGPAGEAPSASIVGGATKSQQGAVNVEAMRAASIPGLELMQDPALYPADVVKSAREYKTKSDQFTTGTRILKEYWERAADQSLPEVERRKALNDYRRYRGDLIAKMSVKNDQGVVTNPEMEQRVRTMPEPALNLIQQGKQAWDEFFNEAYYGADMFDRILDEQGREAAATLANYAYRFRPGQEPAPTGARGAGRAGGGAAGKRKPAIKRLSREDL